jgi:hypothetical protein
MGWEGLLCDRPCRRGYYSHLCAIECPCASKHSDCDPHTGLCQCLTGFTGNECSLECDQNKYGFGCKKKCECNAQTSHGCDPITGRCLCLEGWHGKLYFCCIFYAYYFLIVRLDLRQQMRGRILGNRLQSDMRMWAWLTSGL